MRLGKSIVVAFSGRNLAIWAPADCNARSSPGLEGRPHLDRHFSPQLIAGLPVYLPHRAIHRWRNAHYGNRPELSTMKTLLLSMKSLLVERRELITNWLALLALLAVGVVWPPV